MAGSFDHEAVGSKTDSSGNTNVNTPNKTISHVHSGDGTEEIAGAVDTDGLSIAMVSCSSSVGASMVVSVEEKPHVDSADAHYDEIDSFTVATGSIEVKRYSIYGGAHRIKVISAGSGSTEAIFH